jgi:type II secretory pathway component PulF
MPRYQFSAASADGTVISGIERSDGVNLMRGTLLERDLQPISIAEKKSILQFEITKKTVKKREVMHLCRQLSVFVRSGVSVIEALLVLSEESSDKLLRTGLESMRVALESGSRFSEAAADHPEIWPGYTVEVIRSAELTGNLDEVLDQLGDYLEREIDTEQKVKSALAYPSIVMGLAIVVSVVLVVYVLPKFKTFFDSLHAKLPLPTRLLLALGLHHRGDHRRSGAPSSRRHADRDGRRDHRQADLEAACRGQLDPHRHHRKILPPPGLDDGGRGIPPGGHSSNHRSHEQRRVSERLDRSTGGNAER